MKMQNYRSPLGQRGVALITALLLLLVATMLAVSMFRSFGTQEKLAGNLREKERALHAAEIAEQYAEWSLINGNAGPKGICNSVVDSTSPQICTNALSSLTTVTSLNWPAGVWYVPPDPATGANMKVTTTSAMGTYYSKPMYYVQDLGLGFGGEIFQIDAMGVGGTSYNNSPNAVAVVESTYVVISNGGHCADPAVC